MMTLLLPLLLLAAGCGASADSTVAGAAATTPTEVATPSTDHSMDMSMDPNMDMSTHPSAGPVAPASVVEVRVAVKGGKVTPPTHRVKVAKGKTVRLVVTTDALDEVHVHGYDVKAVVAAGGPAPVEFVADQAGIFEIEMEKQAIQLLQVEVR